MTLSKIICRASSCPVNSCGKESSCQCERCEFAPWAGKIPWRRKWQPIPVFLPGKSSEERSLAGYISWGQKRVRHGLMNKQNNVIFRSFDLDIPSRKKWGKESEERCDAMNSFWYWEFQNETDGSCAGPPVHRVECHQKNPLEEQSPWKSPGEGRAGCQHPSISAEAQGGNLRA